MAKRPILSGLIIVLGIVLIVAGYGYTVNRVSALQQDSKTAPLKTDGNKKVARQPDDLHFKRTLPPAAGAMANSNKIVPTSFFYPAMTLLSGAILCAAGAIALVHRSRGIGVN